MRDEQLHARAMTQLHALHVTFRQFSRLSSRKHSLIDAKDRKPIAAIQVTIGGCLEEEIGRQGRNVIRDGSPILLSFDARRLYDAMAG